MITRLALPIGIVAAAMAFTAYADVPNMLAGASTPILPVSMEAEQPELEQTMCSTRDQMVSMLAKSFQEAPTAVGMVDSDAVVEIFVSPDHGTWTILASDPAGNSCIISAGEGWQESPLPGFEEQV